MNAEQATRLLHGAGGRTDWGDERDTTELLTSEAEEIAALVQGQAAEINRLTALVKRPRKAFINDTHTVVNLMTSMARDWKCETSLAESLKSAAQYVKNQEIEIERMTALVALADEQLRVNNALMETYRNIAIDSNRERAI